MPQKFDITNFNDPRVMAMMGMAQGLLASSGYSHRPISTGEAMANGMQGGMQGYMQGQHMQQNQQDFDLRNMQVQSAHNEAMRKLNEQQMMEDTIKKFKDGGSRKDISQALIGSGMPGLIEMGLKLAPKVKTTAKGLDAAGNPVIHNVYDTGETDSTGIRPAERLMQINRGGQIDLANPFTGQAQAQLPVSMNPGQAAQLAQSANQFNQSHGLAQQNAQFNQQRSLMELDPEFQARKAEMIAGGRERGQMQVKAAADLPQAIQQGTETVKLVDDLLKHPGFKISVGGTAPVGSALAMVPGTEAASFNIALNQLKGKQFIEAFQSLKGGGAITEMEGQKATQAMSRMEKANTEAEFTKAAREFQGIVNSGINRAKMKAGVTNNDLQKMPARSPEAASSDGWGELR